MRAKEINEEMKQAAVYAIAELISDEELSAEYVSPCGFDRRVGLGVAVMWAGAEMRTNVARQPVNIEEIRARLAGLDSRDSEKALPAR